DLFGRVLSMTYPDQEVVKYGYNSGGLPMTVTGTRKNGTVTTYVSSITYNDLEQRDKIVLGNNTSTGYLYYPDTKRLKTVSTGAGGPNQFQVLSYTYDLVGNVLSASNDIDVPTPVPPNTVVAPGPSTQTFGYDDLYQLTSASGTYQGCACGCGNDRKYTLTMQ